MCSNLNCNSVFLIKPTVDMGEREFLCPKCRSDMPKSHIIQCACCQSIIDYLPAEADEDLLVIFVDNCDYCFDITREEWGFDNFFSSNTHY